MGRWRFACLNQRCGYWIGTNEITSNLVSSGEARSRVGPRKCMKCLKYSVA